MSFYFAPSFFGRAYHPGLFVVALALLLCAPTPSLAQLPSRSAAQLGTAGGGAATVRDNDAIFFNPANLLLDARGARVVLSIGALQVHGGGSLVQFKHYNGAFTSGDVIPNAELQTILDEWFGTRRQGGTLRNAGVHAEVVPLAVTVRGYAWGAGLAVRSRSYSTAGFSRGFVDLLLLGTEENRTLPVNVALRSMTTTEVSLAFSRLFPTRRLTVGGAARIIFGLNYSEAVMDSRVTLENGSVLHRYDYRIRSAGNFNHEIGENLPLFEDTGFLNAPEADFGDPLSLVAGNGFGIDLGATHEIIKNVHVAASLTDLGFVSWKKNADAVHPVNNEFSFAGIEIDRNRLDDEFDGDFGAYVEDVLTTLIEDSYDNVERDSSRFATLLPTALHAGGAWHLLRGRAVVSAGTSMGLNKAAGNLTRRPSLHFGAEYRLGKRFAVPVRTGLRIGGAGALTLGFGFGLHTPVYDLDIGVAATPRSTLLGGGGHYMIGLSLANFRI